MVLFPLLYHVVPVLHCITTNDTCPTWIYKRYLRYVPPQFRVCGECVQELQFYQNRGRPFSYRQYAAPSYHSIHYGNEMHYRLFPQLAHNLGYRVLFMILTSGDERKERIIIRNNFRSLQSRFNVGYFFVTAFNEEYNQSIIEESQLYRDILQLSHYDSYHNLLLSVLGGFHFITRFNNLTEYVMKTDSDCVVNIPRLLRYLNGMDKYHPQYIGKCSLHWTFNIDDPTQKNYVPPSLVVPRQRFIGYASGGGYILRADGIPRLLIAVRHLPFLTHLEDVTIGMAATSLEYRCKHKSKWIARQGCETKESCLKYMIMHKNTSNSEIERYWSYIDYYLV